jgi:hypothetical protein
MKTLHAFHDKESIVLSWELGRKFILWLACGHSGGMAKANDTVVRRRCRHCGGNQRIVRVEPVA